MSYLDYLYTSFAYHYDHNILVILACAMTGAGFLILMWGALLNQSRGPLSPQWNGDLWTLGPVQPPLVTPNGIIIRCAGKTYFWVQFANKEIGLMTTEEMLANTPLSFESPESSTIHGASYDPDTNTLLVSFKGPGGAKDYSYAGFPPELWIEFTMASSPGKFFSSRIRPFYTGSKL